LLLLFGPFFCLLALSLLLPPFEFFFANTILKGVIIAPRIRSNIIADAAVAAIVILNKTNLTWC